jgi:phenylpyruvate tautomerase PptA (4-oxalocrotonate tautomerase family)
MSHTGSRPLPTLNNPNRYTIVTIECFAGRSLEAKRRLHREIVARLEAFGIPRDHVTVILHEIPLNNWGAFGGLPASDVALGFEIEV